MRVEYSEAGGSDSAMPIKRITPEETKQLLDSDSGYVYIDVRTITEFDAGHVPGAKNIPAFEAGPQGMQPNPRFVEVVERNFARDAHCILGCQKGGRSLRAAEMLAAAGFTRVVDMLGGFGDGWLPRGYPVSRESADADRYETLQGK